MIKKSLVLVSIFVLLQSTTFSPVFAVDIPSGVNIPVTFKYPVESSQINAGDSLAIVIDEDVKVGRSVVFKRGTEGVAFVQKAKGGRAWGRAGYIKIASAQLKDIYGNKHNCSLSVNRQGDGKSSAIILPIVGALIFWPLLFFGFKHGDSITITPGTLFNAFTSASSSL